MDTAKWLPVSKADMEALGWDRPDIIIVSGDAYVDHPSFGHAVIGRVLEAAGFRVCIMAQPNWRDDLRDFKKFGEPRLFFGVTAGCMDSMINHYTAARRLRSDDAYTPGGKAGFRPDYPTLVYSRILKKLFPHIPVVLGGIEASLRRFTHYDYWADALKAPILYESGADLLIHGMGEKAITELCKLLDKGVPFSSIKNLPQSAFLINELNELPEISGWQTLTLASHEECLKNKRASAYNFRIIEEESNKMQSARIYQPVGNSYVVVNPPYPPQSVEDVDAAYDLPYTRMPHPRYKKRGDIPAYLMIRHSVNLHRGCFGGCAFCTISAHQGKFVQSRSKESIERELDQLIKMPDFNGIITDLGGPSANMYRMSGLDLERCKKCRRPSCIWPSICGNLNADHGPLLEIYRMALKKPGVNRVYIGSGVRYDLLTAQRPEAARRNSVKPYMEQLITKHVSGRLKVAPEHTSEHVLKIMRKPAFEHFKVFRKAFLDISAHHGLNQQLIPYLISSHPGCKLTDMANLALETKNLGYCLEQIQDFTPTPMTLATEMYYTGLDPYTLEDVYTARKPEDKEAQRKYFFWYKPENKVWLKQSLQNMRKPEYIDKLFGRSLFIPKTAGKTKSPKTRPPKKRK